MNEKVHIQIKVAAGMSIIGYLISLMTSRFLPEVINLTIPVVFSLGGILICNRYFTDMKGRTVPETNNPPSKDSFASSDMLEEKIESKSEDPFWDPIIEYIHVIEEMVISEGQKNMLDNEIVEKTLSLLTRVNRLIPQLKAINDGNMNYNIQRLIFKDLNGAINPFLKLSGEAKRLNRRLLLDGLKDINSKLTTFVETIEQKDLIDLQTRMELIQQRYRSTD
ncbi:hypothetical protein NDS46_29635 [Paenibacillus thiaminolyticus]|uniref:hypothetical protein n=1 Tax=Paenibacillus thiaminolyticus TaxID=49283 RepID=UPI00232F0C77|nr:hypothetical protein [Paenibacillus thiaminolyticus]WCF08362.1 hypothetical protein NDS46_29635 [Paenibacillus thiaminolyticus]